MDAKERLLIWKTVIALQAVDALKPSAKVVEIAKQNIEGVLPDEALLDECENLKNEADIVSVRMFVNIIQNQFSISQFELVQIRKALFTGLLESPELLRTANLSKKEWALDGLSLVYPKAAKIQTQLNKLFEAETLFDFEGMKESKQVVKHIASFISGLWALHPFESGNTRTIAVFFIKYLAYRGLALSNDTLAQSPVFFRNALARSAFCDGKKGFHKTNRHLERLLKKIILANIDSLDTKRFIKWEQEIIWKYMVNFDGESKKEEFMWYERQNTEENDVLRTVLPCEYINDDGLKETTSSGKELTRLGF